MMLWRSASISGWGCRLVWTWWRWFASCTVRGYCTEISNWRMSWWVDRGHVIVMWQLVGSKWIAISFNWLFNWHVTFSLHPMPHTHSHTHTQTHTHIHTHKHKHKHKHTHTHNRECLCGGIRRWSSTRHGDTRSQSQQSNPRGRIWNHLLSHGRAGERWSCEEDTTGLSGGATPLLCLRPWWKGWLEPPGKNTWFGPAGVLF